MSDKMRRTVFAELAGGEADFDRLVKHQRLIRVAADRAMNELVTRGLAARTPKGTFALTPTGEEVARDLKSQNLLS